MIESLRSRNIYRRKGTLQVRDMFDAKVRATVENKINFAENHSLLAAQPMFLMDKLLNVENMI